MSADDIVEDIINIGKYCKEGNVINVIVYSLKCRSQKYSVKVKAVNRMLVNCCKDYGFGYVHNSNISVEQLPQDG